MQNLELVFDAAVDPYLRGQANVVLQITPEGETTVELEEAYVTTTSLPHGLQLKAGQFLTEFGRLNPTHPHAWDFVDQPLAIGRFFGGDGLRSAGARLSWLLPTAYYSEAFLTVQNGQRRDPAQLPARCPAKASSGASSASSQVGRAGRPA